MSDVPKIPEQSDELDLGPELDGEEPLDEDAEPSEEEDADDDAGVEDTPVSETTGLDSGAKPGTATARGRASQSQRLRDRLESERQRRAELERRLAALEGRSGQPSFDPAAQARAEAEEWARVQEMSPAEAARWALNKGRQEFGAVLQRQQFELKDQLDRQRYEDQERTSRRYRDYRSRVEQMLANEYARGNLAATREAILRYLVGDDAIKRGQADAPNQRRAAQTRVAAQGARPTGGRGDGGPGGGGTPGQRRRQQQSEDSYEGALDRIRGQALW